MQIWTNFYLQSEPIKWVLFTENDYLWWKIQVKTLENNFANFDAWNFDSKNLVHCEVNLNSFCGYGAVRGLGLGPEYINVNYLLIGSNVKNAPNVNVAIHESVHHYQANYIYRNLKNSLPCWFGEGQATFFENAITPYLMEDKYGGYIREEQIKNLLTEMKGAKYFTATKWIEVINSWKTSNQCYLGGINYSFGLLAFEYIYSEYSIAQIHLVLEEMINGLSWSNALSKVIGIDENSLDSKIANYVQSTLNDA